MIEPSDLVERPCPLCGETAHNERYPARWDVESFRDSFNARHSGKHAHFRIIRCRSCGLYRSSPFPDDHYCKQLYADSKFLYGQESCHAANTYHRLLLSRVKEIQPDWRIVEVGCGNGFLLKELHDKGYRSLTGYELSDDALRHAPPEVRTMIRRHAYGKDVAQPSADLIMSFHLLDHLVDPLGFLRACLARLRPGGRLLAACHNAHALSARILGERSPIWDVSHSVLFTPDTLDAMLKKAGFENPEVAPYVNCYRLGYWLSQLPGGNRLLPRVPTTVAGLPLSLPAGNICAVACKPADNNALALFRA